MGNLTSHKKHIAIQGKKSLFCLLKEVQKHNFNVVTLLSLFDLYVSPVLNCCSEIWGYKGAGSRESTYNVSKEVIMCKTIYKQ